MDLHKIISELESEKRRLDEAIEALERLSSTAPKPKRRGRPSASKQNQNPDHSEASRSEASGQTH